MIHYLYVGHFERDGTFIRFEKVGDRKPALYRPVVQRPLDASVVSELLSRWHSVQIPAQWGMTIDEAGYIVWDRFCGNDDASDFVVELSNHTGCDLANYSSLTLMSADDLKKATDRLGQAKRAGQTGTPILKACRRITITDAVITLCNDDSAATSNGDIHPRRGRLMPGE